MRVLVATNELQGTAPGDYSWTVEGELVVVDQRLADITDEYVEHIEAICRSFPVGTVVERSGQVVQARAVPHAA